MPWNLVSCWSSSDSAPVSTRRSPSAMVPRRKRLRALRPSLADSGGSASICIVLVDIAQVAAFAAQCIECRRAVLAAPIGENALQGRVHVLRHRIGIAADIEHRAIV